MPVGPEDYFFQVTGAGGHIGYCFGLDSTTQLGTILGDVFMQGYNVFFDRENQRVGFAPIKDCVGPEPNIAVLSGNGQSGTAGTPLSQSLAVFGM